MATLQPTIERRQYIPAPLRRVSWGAIFAGAAIATALMVFLGLLGIAIGATVIDAESADSPSARAFGIGAGIWWALSGILSLFAGGWAAGRLAGLRRHWEAPLHGLVTWAVAMTAMVLLMGSALGAVASGAFHVVSTSVRIIDDGGAVTSKLGHTMDTMPGRMDASSDRRELRRRDDGATAANEDTVREVADQAADAVATAAWWSCLFLFLSAVAATLGGLAGIPQPRTTTVPSEREVTS